MIGHQYSVRAIMKDLESQYGASAVLHINQHLSRADELLRSWYQTQIAKSACVESGAVKEEKPGVQG